MMPPSAQILSILQEMVPSLGKVVIEGRVWQVETRKRVGLMEGRYSSLWPACEKC